MHRTKICLCISNSLLPTGTYTTRMCIKHNSSNVNDDDDDDDTLYTTHASLSVNYTINQIGFCTKYFFTLKKKKFCSTFSN